MTKWIIGTWIVGVFIWLAIYALAEADENGNLDFEWEMFLFCVGWPIALWIALFAWLGGKGTRRANTPHH